MTHVGCWALPRRNTPHTWNAHLPRGAEHRHLGLSNWKRREGGSHGPALLHCPPPSSSEHAAHGLPWLAPRRLWGFGLSRHLADSLVPAVPLPVASEGQGWERSLLIGLPSGWGEARIQAPLEAPGPTPPVGGSRQAQRGLGWAAAGTRNRHGAGGQGRSRVFSVVLPMAAEAVAQDCAVTWGLCEATSAPQDS